MLLQTTSKSDGDDDYDDVSIPLCLPLTLAVFYLGLKGNRDFSVCVF